MKKTIGSLSAQARLTLVLLTSILLAACSSSDGASLSVESSDGLQAWELTAPAMLLNRGVDQTQLFPDVTLNGVTLNLEPIVGGDSTIFRGTTQVPEGEDVLLRVDWFEFFNGRELLLAVAENTYSQVSSDTNVVLREDDYIDDDLIAFPRLDDDSDRVPNLAERVEGSDPLSATDPGLFRANAFVGAIDPSRAPIIDGSFDLIWGEAQYRDRDDELLQIDNRMIGFDSDRPEGSTEYRWGALHDGLYLYLYVLGESAANRNSNSDSVEPWHDDAIDIFWDGNRSQGSSYDGVDDYHLIIPLLKLGDAGVNRSNLDDGSPDPDGRAETGINSLTIEGLEGVTFATCVCPTSDTYEIRLDLEQLQIPIDRSFGFDIQMNNDVDGELREFKFGWRAPSAGENEFSNDLTWEDPSRMGLLQLVPLN